VAVRRLHVSSAGAGAALLALLALAVPATGGATPAPRAQLVRTMALGDGAVRYSYRYGPLPALAGQNQIMVAPAVLERPPGDGFVTRVVPDVVGADGRPPHVDVVHMHHAVVVNLSRRDATRPELPERFFAFAEEKTRAELPYPYGYPLRATDLVAVNYMLHNGTPQTHSVWITYELDWVPAGSPLGQRLRPARPVWLDVQNGKIYPVFDVLRGQGGDGRFTYPDEAPRAYAGEAPRNRWTVDRDGTLVAAAGHVHPGGLHVDLDAVRDANRARLFRSEARYFDPGGPISWDLAMTYTPPEWRVRLRRGDVLTVSATYDTTRADWYESMGILLAYFADDATGVDPFAGRVPTRGEITHGHLPEAGNHGGRATSLPDATALRDGQTLANGIAIASFAYLPGDLAQGGGGLGLPPVVAPGQSLRFGNFDASLGIHHTITACKAPCNRSTGVSYPLADGDVRFDSGQLGGGFPGWTAAANRFEWTTPPDLEPGTYTYFCRVHPFMRGAFRVSGSPRRSAAKPAAHPVVRARRLWLRRDGSVRVRVTCSAGDGACTGRVELRTLGRAPRRLAAARLAVPAGRTASVRLRLGRGARRLVASGAVRRVRVVLRSGSGAVRTSPPLALRRGRG
jgi:plastocyanin